MKVKKYLSAFAAVGVVAFSLVACSDYDNGYNESAIQFTEEFKKAYGDIDPEQDWNLAERASVTVSTQTQSDIKIYAQNGNEYAIVANYKGVSGTRVLGFDVVEGVTDVIVSDGHSAQQVKIGDVVLFGQDTRTAWEGQTLDGMVKVTKIADDAGIDIGGVNYPKYRYSTEEEMEVLLQTVPEISNRGTFTNLNKVTHDFSYVSTGSFVIYPYFWNTSSNNTLAVYYYNKNGELTVTPVYTIKTGDELYFEERYDQLGGTDFCTDDLEGWTAEGSGYYSDFRKNTWSTEGDNDGTGFTTPFFQYWRSAGNNLEDVVIKKTITGLPAGDYYVTIQTRLYNEANANVPNASKAEFFANGNTVNLLRETILKPSTNKKFGESQAKGFRVGEVPVKCTVGSDGKLEVGYTLQGVSDCNWIAFKDLKVVQSWGQTKWSSTEGRNSFGQVLRGQGIKVDIPEGTAFGMCLIKSTNTYNPYEANSADNITHIFYSQSELNDPALVGNGVVDDGLNTSSSIREVEGMHPCYASTFYAGGQMFLGFEDWPNTYKDSDFDLNDLVVAFSGCTPTIINEDPEPAATWLLACEDLGGSFDTDYNDVVFKVEHVSGQEFAIATPLAAGGTLASYIFYESPSGQETCLGEIHQLFGEAPAESGSYSPINVGYSRGNAGQSVTFTVPADWSMSSFTPDVWDGNTQDAYYNMGGFEIRTLPMGTEAPDGTPTLDNIVSSGASRIPAPDQGAAPYIICLPYSYDVENDPEAGWKSTYVWAWPQELVTITPSQTDKYGSGCYPEFKDWVSNHTAYADWYKKRSQNAATVEELKLSTTQMGSSSQGGSGTSSQSKQASQLGNKGDIMVVQWETADLYANLTNATLSTGQITYYYKFNSDGELTQNGNNASTLRPGITGERYIVVRQDADDNYEAGETVFKMTTVIEKPILYFTDSNGNTLSAGNVNGNFAQISYNVSDANQQWQFVPTGDGYYYLFNKGANGYLHLSSENSWNGVFQSSKPIDDANGMFKIELGSNGGIFLKLRGNNGYVGYDVVGNGNSLFLDKGEYNKTTFSAYDINTAASSAKQRNAKRR